MFTIQVVVICSLVSCCSFIYVHMQFVDLPQWVIFFGSVCFSLSSGCPGVIYVFLNHNLRLATLRMFRLTCFSNFAITQTYNHDDCGGNKRSFTSRNDTALTTTLNH